MKSVLEEILTLKTLSAKHGRDSGKAMDMVLSDPSNQDALKGKVKNVCAALHMPLVERLEDTLGILDMTKREFFELAIIEALDKADLIIKDSGLFEHLEAVSKAIESIDSKEAA